MLARAHRARRTPRTQILELYLNKVYFGDGLYGVEAASRGYFGKHASELSRRRGGAAGRPGEVAVELRADRQPASARSRGATSCCRRCSTPAPSISAHVGGGPRASKVVLQDGLRADEPHGQYFKEQVRQELVERFGWQRVYQGGLRVYSTIDMPMQLAAEAAVGRGAEGARRSAAQALAARRAAAKTAPRRSRDASRLQAALVAHGSGDRARARDGRRPRLRREPLQSRGAGPAAARLGLQAVRLRRRARSGLHAGERHRST